MTDIPVKPSIHPRLINDPFSDPGLYIPFLFEKRAVMFDLGDLGPLTPREILKISHIFVTHTHMDHFIGFDKLLRICLGREKELHIFGPEGFFKNVEGKLRGYTWNLVEEYENNFILRVTEVHKDKLLTRRYMCREGFGYNGTIREKQDGNLLLRTPRFRIECAFLDHRIPCMGLSLIENFSVNIIKEGLKRLDLETGPWLTGFKKAVYEDTPPDSVFTVTRKRDGKTEERAYIMGDLIKDIAAVSPGQKITYVADAIGSPENLEKIISLAQNSDHLFIEAAFTEEDFKTAQKKYHLTAQKAGETARRAGVKKLSLFHFSPRYSNDKEKLIKEAMSAFKGRKAGRTQ